MKRLLRDVAPADLLYCTLGEHHAEARNFVTRGPNRGEAHRSPAYRAYCKDCHRQRNGATPAAPALKSAGHTAVRKPIQRDPEVAHALGVLRDARGQREGRQGYVYLIVEDNVGGSLGYGKIGFSTNPAARVAELQTGNPRPLKLHCAKAGTVEDEVALHAKYIAQNRLQEWFTISRDMVLEFDLNSDLVPFGKDTA